MAVTTLSLVAKALRTALSGAFPDGTPTLHIGPPADATNSQKPLINLFFYRIEPGAYPSHGDPADPTYLRLFCLITPFAESGPTASAGDRELELLGTVLATLHRNPMLKVYDTDAPELLIAELQIVSTPVTLEALNNLWSTQKEVAYRLSAAYELALVPVSLDEEVRATPFVLSTQVSVGVRVGGLPSAASPPELYFEERGNRRQVVFVSQSESSIELPLRLTGADPAQVELLWETYPSSASAPAPTQQHDGWLLNFVPSQFGQLVARARRNGDSPDMPSNRVAIVILRPGGDA